MPKTFGRAGRKPMEGSRFLGQILGDNIAALRATFGPALTQADLAERMRFLGHDWTASTVADLEHNRRTVHVEELGGLAIALHASIPRLLDPGQTRGVEANIDVGGELDTFVLGGETARSWVYGQRRYALQDTKSTKSGWEVSWTEGDAPPVPKPIDMNEELRKLLAQARTAKQRRKT